MQKFKLLNKIWRNDKVYFLHLGTGSYFTAHHRQPLAPIGLQFFKGGLICQKLGLGKAKFDFVYFKVEYYIMLILMLIIMLMLILINKIGSGAKPPKFYNIFFEFQRLNWIIIEILSL